MSKLLKPRSISSKLTATSPEQRETHDGQAHLAGTGPSGRTCRECVHWACGRGEYKNNGELKSARCNKFSRLTGGRKGREVPHHALACRHFEFSAEPPKAFKHD